MLAQEFDQTASTALSWIRLPRCSASFSSASSASAASRRARDTADQRENHSAAL